MINKLFFSIILFILLSPLVVKPISASIPANVDVVIAGAGTGGTTAAIQAARGGATVLLLEETDYIGGQMSAAGVTTMDGTGTGFFEEFINRVKAYYIARGKSISDKSSSSLNAFEAHVGQQILKDILITEPNITLSLKTKITRVVKSGTTITSVVLSNGQTVNTKILIDATEYGDILPLAGANYRVGNGTNTSPANNSCVQDITYPAFIKNYPQGVPTALKFNSAPPGYANAVSGFATIVTRDGHDTGWASNYPFNFRIHNAYRGIPDSSSATDTLPVTKTGINFANDYPAPRPYRDYSNGVVLSTRYIEDLDYRKQINCEAKLKTLQFLYYVQDPNGLNEPNWAISTDEGYNTPYNIVDNSCSNIPAEFKTIEQYLPVKPYVREGRRMIGLKTLVASEIKSRSGIGVNTSIALGGYATDIRNCSSAQYFESSLETANNYSSGESFQVPIEALISNNIDNLLAAEKNISVSRTVNGAIRLQPITMLTGQASGALAAIAVKQNKKPAQVKALDVQKILLKAKSNLVLYTDFDNTHPYSYDMQLISLRGIMSGYGNKVFGVNDQLTRGTAALITTTAFKIPPITIATPTFADVPVDSQLASSIEAFYRAGFTSGCNENPKKFCPDNIVTNAQMAFFAVKGWVKMNPSITPTSPTSPTYSDVPTNSPFYPHIETLAQKGIKLYCDEPAKKFCPDSTVNRATVSRIINSILDKEDTISTSTPTPKPGDLNGDNTVNLLDFNLLIAKFGNPYTLLDFNLIIANFGKTR